MNIKILDLFCGGGGAAMGIHQSFKIVDIEHEITGVDIQDLSNTYPFSFIQSNVFDLELNWMRNFDLIWASPPCQAYSYSTMKWRNEGKEYPDLLGKTRKLLLKIKKPFIIENVIGSPIRKDLLLCGEMFNLRIIRHRLFEIFGFYVPRIKHREHKRKVIDGTALSIMTGGTPGCFGDKEKRENIRKYYVTVAGHGGDGGKGNTTLQAWQEAIEIDWINDKKVLAECVAPAYSRYIANHYIKSIGKPIKDYYKKKKPKNPSVL